MPQNSVGGSSSRATPDRDAPPEAPDQQAVNAVLVALDACLAGGRPDARFVSRQRDLERH